MIYPGNGRGKGKKKGRCDLGIDCVITLLMFGVDRGYVYERGGF